MNHISVPVSTDASAAAAAVKEPLLYQTVSMAVPCPISTPCLPPNSFAFTACSNCSGVESWRFQGFGFLFAEGVHLR